MAIELNTLYYEENKKVGKHTITFNLFPSTDINKRLAVMQYVFETSESRLLCYLIYTWIIYNMNCTYFSNKVKIYNGRVSIATNQKAVIVTYACEPSSINDSIYNLLSFIYTKKLNKIQESRVGKGNYFKITKDIKTFNIFITGNIKPYVMKFSEKLDNLIKKINVIDMDIDNGKFENGQGTLFTKSVTLNEDLKLNTISEIDFYNSLFLLNIPLTAKFTKEAFTLTSMIDIDSEMEEVNPLYTAHLGKMLKKYRILSKVLSSEKPTDKEKLKIYNNLLISYLFAYNLIRRSYGDIESKITSIIPSEIKSSKCETAIIAKLFKCDKK